MRNIISALALMLVPHVVGQTLPGLTITNNTFTYHAPDGLVSGIIRLPAGSGPFPALLISHGKGGSPVGFSLQHANILVDWGFACIGPEYTHVGGTVNPPENEGYCAENSRRARRALEILSATPNVDMTRLALFGHSMGSFITGGLAGEIPTQIKAACISAGGTSGQNDVGLASPAVQEVQGITAPFLMFHGTADTTVLPSQSLNLQSILAANGVPNKRLLYQEIGHDIISSASKRTDIHAIARAWFTQQGVLVFAGNTAPAIATAASISVTAGASATPLAITMGDPETAPSALTLQVFTTDDTRLPNSGLVLGGSGTNRTLTISPPSGKSGTVEVALAVTDGQLATASFIQVTIQPPQMTNVNHRPAISWIADQRTTPGTAVNGIAFNLEDPETAVAALTISATSSNATLLPVPNIVFGGSGSSRTVSLTPAIDQSSTSTITLTVSDATKTSAIAFTLTVAATVPGNTPPTIQAIAGETIPTGTVFGSVPLIVKDTEKAESSLVLTATSSNTALVPVSSIVFGGQAYGRTVQVTPAPGQTGRSTITLAVSDGTNTSSIAFVLEVMSGDTPPVPSGLPTLHSAVLGSTPESLAFTVSDAETAAADLRITAISSNTSLLPNAGISFGGTGDSRHITLSPLSGQTGAATITLSLSDGTYTRREQLLLVVTDPDASAAQFSRPRGVFILDSGGPLTYTTSFGSTISLRDANLRSLPFVDGFTLRVAWSDVESGTTPGHYDFFIIQNLLDKLPAGQRLSIIIVPTEPAYIAATPGVQTWSDAGLTRATPWDAYLRARRRALLNAMASIVTSGVVLRNDPRLDVLDPYLPGGFTGIRDPNSTPLRNLPGYSRENLLAAVRDELGALQQEFPGKFVQIGFWPITDGQDVTYNGVTASEWTRRQLLVEFNGLTRPRVGFFMENLAARRSGPSVDPYSATPVTGFGSALFNSRDAVWTGFQMLGSWTRPFNDGHVTNTLHGTPNDALEFAFNTYRAEYHEVYIGDIDHPSYQAALQRWHDFYASAVTTSPASDEDGDGIPFLLEYAFHQPPGIPGTSGLPTSSTVIDSADGLSYPHYHYLRRNDAPHLNYTVEVSPDLSLWRSGSTFTRELTSVPTGDGITNLVTVRLLDPVAPGTSGNFVRLRVTTP